MRDRLESIVAGVVLWFLFFMAASVTAHFLMPYVP